MAFVRQTETPDSGKGSVTETGGREYERVFRIEFDSINHDSIEAISHIPIHRNDPYVSPNGLFFDPWALAGKADADREEENSPHWIVRVPYSTKLWEEAAKGFASGGTGPSGSPPSVPGGPGGSNPDSSSLDNPLNRPWKVAHSTTSVRRRMVRDRASVPKCVANSAGDPLYYEREQKCRVITITRNVPLPSIQTQLDWEELEGTVNDNVFLGRDAGTVKCERIDGTTEYENYTPFFAQTCEFIVMKVDDDADTIPDVWKVKLLDAGVNVAGIFSDRAAILDDHGIRVTEPVPLDGLGNKLSRADRDAGNFKYLLFTEFPPRDFSILGLG